MKILNKPNSYHLNILIVTCLLLAIIHLGSWLKINTAGEMIEHRDPYMRPVISVSGFFKDSYLPNDINRYLQDRAGFRNIFIKTYVYIKLNVLNNQRIFGGIRPKNGNVFETVSPDKMSFTPIQLKTITTTLEQEYQLAKSQNITYLFAVTPRKNTILKELVPYDIDQPFNLRSDQLIEYLKRNSNVPVLDLRSALLKADRSYPLYFKTDSHWTNYGAFFAYDAIMAEYKKTNPKFESLYLSDFQIQTVSYPSWQGDESLKSFTMLGDPDEDVLFSPFPIAYSKKSNLTVLSLGDSYLDLRRTVPKDSFKKRFPELDFLIPQIFTESTDPKNWQIKNTYDELIALIKKAVPNKIEQNKLINYLFISSLLNYDSVGINHFLELNFEKSIIKKATETFTKQELQREKPTLIIREITQNSLDLLLNIR